jgi:phenylpyruvate tautomerase PptA (4-oxalocrotonate tautomerase family)
MPIYRCSAPKGLLTDAMREKIASAITDAHVAATGAPRAFVHVFFSELPPGAVYSADGVDRKLSGITGAIRAGRPVKVKQELLKKITESWSAITGQPAKQIVAGISDLDPETVMEYGLILPRPGGEAEWFRANRDALDGITGTGI